MPEEEFYPGALIRKLEGYPRSKQNMGQILVDDPILYDLMKLNPHKVTPNKQSNHQPESINHYSSQLFELLYLLNEEKELDDNSRISIENALFELTSYIPRTNFNFELNEKLTNDKIYYPSEHLSKILIDNYNHLHKFSSSYFNLTLSSHITKYLVDLIYSLQYWEVYHLVYIIPDLSHFLKLIDIDVSQTPFGPIVKPPENYMEASMSQGFQYPFPYPFYNFSYHSVDPDIIKRKLSKINIKPYIDITLKYNHNNHNQSSNASGPGRKKRKTESSPKKQLRPKTIHEVLPSDSFIEEESQMDSQIIPSEAPALDSPIPEEPKTIQQSFQPDIPQLPPIYSQQVTEPVSEPTIQPTPEILSNLPSSIPSTKEPTPNDPVPVKSTKEPVREEAPKEVTPRKNTPRLAENPGDISKSVEVKQEHPNLELSSQPIDTSQNPVSSAQVDTEPQQPKPLQPKGAYESDQNKLQKAKSKSKPQSLPYPPQSLKSGISIQFEDPSRQPIPYYTKKNTTSEDSDTFIVSKPEVKPKEGVDPETSEYIDDKSMLTQKQDSANSSGLGYILKDSESSTSEDEDYDDEQRRLDEPQLSRQSSISKTEANKAGKKAGELTIIRSEHEKNLETENNQKQNRKSAIIHQCHLSDPNSNKPCLKIFYGKNELLRHQEFVHATKKKIYKCIYCSRSGSKVQSYPRHDSLARHIRRKHGVTGKENKLAVNYAKENVEIIDESGGVPNDQELHEQNSQHQLPQDGQSPSPTISQQQNLAKQGEQEHTDTNDDVSSGNRKRMSSEPLPHPQYLNSDFTIKSSYAGFLLFSTRDHVPRGPYKKKEKPSAEPVANTSPSVKPPGLTSPASTPPTISYPQAQPSQLTSQPHHPVHASSNPIPSQEPSRLPSQYPPHTSSNEPSQHGAPPP